MVPTEERRWWADDNGAGGDGGGPDGVAYVEISETGHMLPVEAPDELADAIVVWLGGLPG
ncbi:hypothetical protein ACTHRK_18455 [Dietzia cercidiphylli]|uniref:hypothetical protein n=1 Tax=Dietzia cercidiphylli TaxID=498199 RepID=UPI003F8133A0